MAEVDLDEYRRTLGHIKEAEKKLATAARKRLREAVKPIGEEVVQEGADALPSRGGLSDRVASGGRVAVSLTGKGATLRLTNRFGYSLGPLDRGDLRHPVFGRGWVSQRVPEQAFTRPFLARREQVADALMGEVRAVLKDIR